MGVRVVRERRNFSVVMVARYSWGEYYGTTVVDEDRQGLVGIE